LSDFPERFFGSLDTKNKPCPGFGGGYRDIGNMALVLKDCGSLRGSKTSTNSHR
jgi:hypothetical protein